MPTQGFQVLTFFFFIYFFVFLSPALANDESIASSSPPGTCGRVLKTELCKHQDLFGNRTSLVEIPLCFTSIKEQLVFSQF